MKDWGLHEYNKAYDAWPKNADGSTVAPAFLTHCSPLDLDAEMVQSMKSTPLPLTVLARIITGLPVAAQAVSSAPQIWSKSWPSISSTLKPKARHLSAKGSRAITSSVLPSIMAEVVRAALGVSKLLWRTSGEKLPQLLAQEAFWLATAGGASFFGKAGAFEPGYDFDAVAVDDSNWRVPDDDLQTRFEKMIYRSSGCDVKAKYVAGRKIF